MLKAMSKFQGMLKMFMLGMLKTLLKYEKTPSHFTACVEIERQISFFSFDFTRVTEVRHIWIFILTREEPEPEYASPSRSLLM